MTSFSYDKRSQIICLPGNGFKDLHLLSAASRKAVPCRYLHCFGEMHRMAIHRKQGGGGVANGCQVFKL